MTNLKKIEIYARAVREKGPIKVLVSESELISANKSKLSLSVIYIRDDGWSLGAPQELEEEAFRLFSDNWVAVLRTPFDKFQLVHEQKVR